MLFVTVGLLLASLALLVAGFVQDSFQYTYGAIGCAAVAAVLLVLFNGMIPNRAAGQAASPLGNTEMGRRSSASTARAGVINRIARPRKPSAPLLVRDRTAVRNAPKPKHGRHAASSRRPPIAVRNARSQKKGRHAASSLPIPAAVGEAVTPESRLATRTSTGQPVATDDIGPARGN